MGLPGVVRLVGYVRTSAKSESPENQVHAIHEFAARNGFMIVDIVKDEGVSGAVPASQRPGWNKAMQLLRDNKADGIIVYALDRIARSLSDLHSVYKEVVSAGKELISVRESWLNELRDPKLREFLVTVLGWVAEMERELIRARTKEAMQRLKAEGKLKRGGKYEKLRPAVLAMLRDGHSLGAIAKALGVSKTAVSKWVKADPELRKAYVANVLRRLGITEPPPNASNAS